MCQHSPSPCTIVILQLFFHGILLNLSKSYCGAWHWDNKISSFQRRKWLINHQKSLGFLSLFYAFLSGVKSGVISKVVFGSMLQYSDFRCMAECGGRNAKFHLMTSSYTQAPNWHGTNSSWVRVPGEQSKDGINEKQWMLNKWFFQYSNRSNYFQLFLILIPRTCH